ncbi:MAG: PTS sugar transporter subunit IIC/EAL domain-containing protein [Blautia sp.]|jgi:lactose/cellobiose-specific phosphotransferase system IIC component
MASSFTLSRFRNSAVTQSIRHGLTLAIPFLIMGSFSLLIRNFPSSGYQAFLESFLSGAAASILETLYNVSLGSLALILIITISLSYGQLVTADTYILYPIVSLSSYLAFCGGIQDRSEYIFSAEWVFTAMCITLLSCVLLRQFLQLSDRLERLHTTGAEYLFNISIQSLFPVILTILLFGITGYLLRTTWGSSNITNFGSYLFLRIFYKISGNLSGILLYVILTHVLWFFGIHGTNTLEAVSQKLFEQNVTVNQSLLQAGSLPTEIFSKTFLDTFVFLGGCGCALSFVIALCIVSQKSHNRKIAYVALPSALFNISEIAVFGFPIIFNFTMAIPFILTPVVLTLVSFLAAKAGLVPLVTQSVEWTVPILVSGYKATGSIAGSLLQVVNLVIGVLIYLPFIKRSEKNETSQFQKIVRRMEQDMAAGEKSGILPLFLHRKYPYSYYAKTLSMDLKNALRRQQVELYYQPQISSQGTMHGLEALLRWKHPVTGYISPPVVLALAYEGGFLSELSTYILKQACKDACVLEPHIKDELVLSVNISAKQLIDDRFFEESYRIIESCHLKRIHFTFEITERAAMNISSLLIEQMHQMQEKGIQFSLDDFGMGHNSILYLQEGIFHEVKLDGQLVSQLPGNERSQEIIAGIIHMGQNLHLRVVAEFVESKEQRDMLEELGCHIYQGYYYSRPKPLDDLISEIETAGTDTPYKL